MATQPDRVFHTLELADLLERSPLRLGRPANRLVFDALRKADHRGWVKRVGRGRYQFGAMPRTTLQRIIRWREALDLGLAGPERSAYASWHRTTKDGAPLDLSRSRP